MNLFCKNGLLTEGFLHVWGDGWKYEAEDSCIQVRICQRCGEKEKATQLAHVWGEWEYAAEDSCIQIRICQRCGEKEKATQLVHVWGEWEYEAEDSCIQVRICQRCKEKKKIGDSDDSYSLSAIGRSIVTLGGLINSDSIDNREDHVWGELEYEREKSCQQIQICQRCGKRKPNLWGKAHTWGDWEYTTPCKQMYPLGEPRLEKLKQFPYIMRQHAW